ncbi:YdhR family protein [Streptomyces sp. TG1A-60]|uniref:YdhR family protein n=1 Tax=Streptomyces sp. TG1A-60 TaxID=3129111 RepID=UPI0030CFDE27
MHAQLITYKLRDISVEQYTEQMVTPDSAYFAKIDTLVSKVWLADEATNSYGGFYLWVDQAAMTAFMSSDAVKTVMARPYLSDIASTDWPVNEPPSVLTRGVVTA